jgi:hypothetical protein
MRRQIARVIDDNRERRRTVFLVNDNRAGLSVANELSSVRSSALTSMEKATSPIDLALFVARELLVSRASAIVGPQCRFSPSDTSLHISTDGPLRSASTA